MLCLKAQVVEDDPRASPSLAGVFLPINLSISLHRYLRKNGRGGSYRSFSSSGDGSGTPSRLEVRIFKPGNVIETLKKSLKDYVQASVGVSNKGKLLVPKFLYCFAKGIVKDSLLPEWICQFLSPEQAAVVRGCSSNRKWRLRSARGFSILSFDSRFREDRTLPKKRDNLV